MMEQRQDGIDKLRRLHVIRLISKHLVLLVHTPSVHVAMVCHQAGVSQYGEGKAMRRHVLSACRTSQSECVEVTAADIDDCTPHVPPKGDLMRKVGTLRVGKRCSCYSELPVMPPTPVMPYMVSIHQTIKCKARGTMHHVTRRAGGWAASDGLVEKRRRRPWPVPPRLSSTHSTTVR